MFVEAPALAVVPVVPTVLPEPVAPDRLDPFALALLVALDDPDVPARSDAALRSRSRLVALAVADVSG